MSIVKQANVVRWGLVILLALAIGMFVTPDVFPRLHTFGVSVGTNTSYCSGELVNWTPELSCQNGE